MSGRARSPLQIVCASIAVLYAFGMLLYLVLRVMFGDGFWWLSLLNTFAHLLFVPVLPLLALALLTRSWLALLSLTLIAAIGGLWVAPYFLPAESGAAASYLLRAVTLNVRVDSPDMTAITAWLRDTDTDIVLLQDLTAEAANTVADVLSDVYPNRSGDSEDSSDTLILSRYPIHDTARLEWEFGPFRQLLQVEVDVNGQPVSVYNVHLAWPTNETRWSVIDNAYINMALAFDDRIRNQQIAALIQRLAKETNPYIVGGNFNTSATSVTYQQLAAAMHDSFYESGSGLGLTWPVNDVLPPLLRLDYIWHSDHFRTVAASTGPRLSSDHLPVQVSLALKSPA